MVFPSPLCAIEVFAVGFIMIHQYVWLSFTIFSLFVGNFLEFFFWLTAPESCRIVESSTAEDFLCVVHWVAPGCSQFARWHLQTMRTALNPYWMLCFECIHPLDHCLQNSNLQVNWLRFSQFTICCCEKLLKTCHLLESLKPWHLVFCFPHGVLAAFPCVSRIWCFGIVDLRQSFWSKSAPVVTRVAHFGTSEAESHRNLPPLFWLCGFWLFLVSFKVAKHDFMMFYISLSNMVFILFHFPSIKVLGWWFVLGICIEL